MTRQWGTDGSAGDSPELLDVALSHRQRRFIVYELCQEDALDVGELVDRLYEWGRIGQGGRSREEVSASLRGTHVPILRRAEIVEYDVETDTISLKPSGNQARELRRLAVAQAQRPAVSPTLDAQRRCTRDADP